MISNCVLLLKSQKTDGATDRYEELLRNKGYDVRSVKTLVFEFKNLDVLKNKLENPDNYNGIFFSSPRCVHAVELATKEEPHILKTWSKKKYNFVVGEATYRDALQKLGIECKGSESGNAVALSKIILEGKNNYSNSKPFLFPHGNLKTDTLSRELGSENIQIEGVLVYDTIANPDIQEEIREATNNFKNIPAYVVFFSPSGLRSSVNYLRKVDSRLDSIKLIAIGPVTELAIQEENLTVHRVAKSPNPEEVLNAILQ